jgi:hypothetical protein
MVQGMGQIDKVIPAIAAMDMAAAERCRKIVEGERNAGFPETAAVVESHKEAVKVIAKAAYDRFVNHHSEWVEDHFPGTPILSARR